MKGIFKISLFFLLGFVIWLCLPFNLRLNENPLSFTLFDRSGELLGARISQDGQWRFAPTDSIPFRFEQSLLTFEDKDFYSHIGVDFTALGRASYQNIKNRRIVSGASTLTMQLMRLCNPNRERTVTQKVKEILWALKAECHLSKKEIINLYSTHAPFGGNVVGLETASWRYFEKSPFDMSWSESALLAVLPNAPSLIHPGKNRDKLMAKRNRLLLRLLENKTIDSLEYNLAILEPIVEKPEKLPNLAPHFLEFVKRKNSDKRSNSTLDTELQSQANGILANHYSVNKSNGIYNGAIIVVDNHTKEVLAYTGNTEGRTHENFNDMVQRPRSSGSVLKPILYALAMSDGLILPEQIAEDIPISINGFSPKNYNLKYSGAVPYSKVVSQSLNVPSVVLLKDYGQERFLNDLKDFGITTLNKTAGHYGLPLILGGGEVNLWELTQLYSSLAGVLTDYNNNSAKYDVNALAPLLYDQNDSLRSKQFVHNSTMIDASSIWFMFKAMESLERPNEDGNWEKFHSSKKIHWKTGTSYGHKDAWAIGVTPQYTVGVWMGNSTGEGRPDIIGVKAAGSVMFDVFNSLDISEIFEAPYNDLTEKNICHHSGMLAGQFCTDVSKKFLKTNSNQNNLCKYHQAIFLDGKSGNRIYKSCANHTIIDTSWFVLSPTVTYYYKRQNPFYASLPELDPNCAQYNEQGKLLEFVYPQEDSDIYLPINLAGEKEKCVFQAKHKNEHSTIYWHLNDSYLGKTEDIHNLEMDLAEGEYVLSIEDGSGYRVSHRVTVH